MYLILPKEIKIKIAFTWPKGIKVVLLIEFIERESQIEQTISYDFIASIIDKVRA